MHRYLEDDSAAIRELVELAREEAMSGLGALPRWLTPPAWLRRAVAGVAQKARVTVQTPAGPRSVDLSDPDQIRQLRDIAKSARLEFGAKAPTLTEQIAGQVEAHPMLAGGMGLLVLGGLALLFLRRR